MKAKLIFNLPEEKEEFEDHYYGTRYRMALQDIDSKLRSIDKCGESCTPNSIREMLYEIADDLDIKIWS